MRTLFSKMNESSCKSSCKVYSLVLYLQCNQSQKEKPFKFLLHFISAVFDDEHFCHNNVYPVFKPNAAEVVVFELTLPSSGIHLVPALLVNGPYYSVPQVKSYCFTRLKTNIRCVLGDRLKLKW